MFTFFSNNKTIKLKTMKNPHILGHRMVQTVLRYLEPFWRELTSMSDRGTDGETELWWRWRRPKKRARNCSAVELKTCVYCQHRQLQTSNNFAVPQTFASPTNNIYILLLVGEANERPVCGTAKLYKSLFAKHTVASRKKCSIGSINTNKAKTMTKSICCTDRTKRAHSQTINFRKSWDKKRMCIMWRVKRSKHNR